MDNQNSKLERLLYSASQARDERAISVPFGFETRVIALWRAGAETVTNNGIGTLVRRVAITAAAIIVVSTAAAIREVRQAEETFNEPLGDEFAIADSAIQNEFSPQ